MATGDLEDMAWRIFAVLPQRWFPALESAPVLRGLLSGLGQAWSFCFGFIVYARQQCRIATATGSFLDMIASDFFGLGLPRRLHESDTSFRERIAANLLSEKATRFGVSSSLSRLTGASVKIFEPGRPADTGGYGSIAQPDVGGGCGFGTYGLAYGSLNLPFQFLITVYRPTTTSGISQVSGYGHIGSIAVGWFSGGYSAGALEYVSDDFQGDTVSDDEIRATVLNSIPVNTLAWLALI